MSDELVATCFLVVALGHAAAAIGYLVLLVRGR